MANEHARGEDEMTHVVMNTAPRAQAQSTIAPDELGALIASRICHDLISPMGAIGNGVELLQLARGVSGPEMELIEQSITHANTRLRLYRLAFGTVGDGQMISQSEIGSLLQALSLHGRHSYQWQDARHFNRRYSKLVFLLILCVESALPWGGDIVIAEAADGLELAARAERMKLDEGLWRMLDHQNPGAELNAARVHFGLLAQELGAQKMTLTLARAPGLLRLHLHAAAAPRHRDDASPDGT